MRDPSSHPWLAYDRDRMFRDVWLPIVAPGQDFSGMSIPLLQDLYPGVYKYGPYGREWLTWADALERYLERTGSSTSPDFSPQQSQEIITMLVQTYGFSSTINSALHDVNLPAGSKYLPLVFDQGIVPWLQDVWMLPRDRDFEAFTWRIYNMEYGAEGFDDVQQALANVAAVIMLRYLPVSPGSSLGREDALTTHNWFCDLYGLPPTE